MLLVQVDLCMSSLQKDRSSASVQVLPAGNNCNTRYILGEVAKRLQTCRHAHGRTFYTGTLHAEPHLFNQNNCLAVNFVCRTASHTLLHMAAVAPIFTYLKQMLCCRASEAVKDKGAVP